MSSLANVSSGGATLFVDDASWLLDSIRSTLERLGFRDVATATSAADADKIMKSRPIGHVVSDLRMPAQRGNQFLLHLKRDRPDLRCTLLTGFVNDLTDEDHRALKAAGIRVAEKSQVDTQWVADLVGVDLSEEPLDTSIPTITKPDLGETTSASDTIAAYRLELETLQQALLGKERLVQFLAQDLLDELFQYEHRDAKTIVASSEAMSINELIAEITRQSPLGLRILELDRAARKRVR
jgi:DNA-binding NarL/FixJ family response regulator